MEHPDLTNDERPLSQAVAHETARNAMTQENDPQDVSSKSEAKDPVYPSVDFAASAEAKIDEDPSLDAEITLHPAEEHGSQHEHSDSLVTVRLSEAHRHSLAEEARGSQDHTLGVVDAGLAEPGEKIRTEHTSTQDLKEGHKSITDPTEDPDHAPQSSHSTMAGTAVSTLDERSPTSSRASTAPSLSAPPGEEIDLLEVESQQRTSAPRSDSVHSRESDSSPLDWAELDKNEKQEQRDEGTDESTAFLLARLEKENNALATDPKSSVSNQRLRSGSRPPSFQQLKKMVSEPTKSPLRYSMLPNPPPMTELEFWTALVRDYAQTAQRLPTLTSNKIRNGVPAPLRGVVWISIAGARNAVLEEEYAKLSSESSPYEKAIHKDVGRSFPGVDMFRDADGEGQRMLSKVLNAFSLWDQQIGYCQGLGFVVGPLIMHMNDKEAFCVLVRLMEHYDLRSCFLPDLSGLHLRVYQFQNLLQQHLPQLTAHLEQLKVEPLYLSQWFLSFFGVTCPLPMLIRIYDVILTEGASETLMRVALSLMRRNEKRILASSEFEDVMQFLLGRAVWDTYNCNANDLVNDFCTWTGLVTREGLQLLENKFKDNQQTVVTAAPTLHSAATRFLGRFWAGAAIASSPKAISPSLSAPSQIASDIRRTTSKQSMASTLHSIESSESSQSTAPTETSSTSRQSSADCVSSKQTLSFSTPTPIRANKDKDLHSQIEDLLMALSNTQREHSALASELQREREEREEDRAVVQKALERLNKGSSLSIILEDGADPDATAPQSTSSAPDLEGTISDLESHFTPASKRSSLVLQTKHQLRDEAQRWKTQYTEESNRSRELARQLTEREAEVHGYKDQLREARARIADAYREKQRLEKINRSQRPPPRSPTPLRSSAALELSVDTSASNTAAAGDSGASTPASTSGLRELKLGRPTSVSSVTTPLHNKRLSSLAAPAVLAATEDHQPPKEEALLLELVSAKTAEAVARQELEEVKGKLDAMRKLMGGGGGGSPGGGSHSASPSVVEGLRWTPPGTSGKATEKEKEREKERTAATVSTSGGFFSGWGKRAVSGTAT